MQNKSITQSQAAASSFQIATCAGNALPPTNFVDTLLAELFPDNSDAEQDILAPFDYQAFLRREGLV